MKKSKLFRRSTLLFAVIALAVALTIGVIAGVAMANEEPADVSYGETYAGASVSTSGKVSLKFYYSSLGTAEGFVAEVIDPKTGEIDGTFEYAAEDLTETEKGFCVAVPLAPSQMTHAVKVYATGADGVATTPTVYSVREYAMDVLADASFAEYHDAMRALLNWGGQAQSKYQDGTNNYAHTGLFERNSNSLYNMNTITYEKGTVVPGTTITGKEMNLSLEPNNLVMHFYVNYTGNGTLSATVSKDGGEAVATDVIATDKGYLVRVANVPASLFDTPYTVTVTDGEDTFTATKTVREYLGVLLADCNAKVEDKNLEEAKRNEASATGNVVRAMYQLYQFVTGNTGADTCEHSSVANRVYWISAGDNKQIVRCVLCHADLGHQAIDAGVNAYAPAHNLLYSTTTGSVNKEIMTENGVEFVRFDNFYANRDNWGDIGITNVFSGNTGVSGQYLVIKFRTGTVSNGIAAIQVFANTNKSASTGLISGGQANFVETNDNQWHTVIINLAERVANPSLAFVDEGDGTYNIRYLSLRMFAGSYNVEDDSAAGRYAYTYQDANGATYTYYGTKLTEEEMKEKGYTFFKMNKQSVAADAYVDIAYVALCDSNEDAMTLVDTNTYEVSVSNTQSMYYMTADGTCAHGSRDSAEVVEGNTYKYGKCAQCGEFLYTKTIPESVSLYFSPKKISGREHSNAIPQKTTFDTLYNAGIDLPQFHVDSNAAYARIYGKNAVAQWIWNRGPGVNGYGAGNTQDYTVNVGKATHFVIKMRTTKPSETIQFIYSCAGVSGNVGTNLPLADVTAGEWVTVVIDLARVCGSQHAADANGDYLVDTFYFHISTLSSDNNVDVAYMAFVEGGLNEVAKIADTDTVLLQTETSGRAYNLDPETCACLEHNSTVKVVNGKYTYSCTVCESIVMDYGVSADATGYFLPAEALYDRVVGTVEGSSVTGKYNNISIETENGETFLRLGDAETNHHATQPWGGWFVAQTSNHPGSGRYMVIKVRQNDNSVNITDLQFWITSTGSTTSWATGGFTVQLPEDNQWHVIVVDLATRATSGGGFIADANGEYGPRTIHVRPFSGSSRTDSTTDEIFDIAYMAFFNDLGDLQNIISEETYEYNKSNTTHAVYDVETHTCAGAHDVKETVSGTTHTIACTDCGKVMKTFEIPADINYYADRSIMTHYGATLTKNLYDEEANLFYNKFYATGGCHFDISGGSPGTAGSWTAAKYDSGKYVVVKYRSTVTEYMYVGTKDHGKRTEDANPKRTSIGALSASGEWKVQVLEIPDNCATYTVNSDQELYFMIGSAAGTFELAYLAVVDDVNEAMLLLEEDETFYLGNSHLDQNMQCVGVCNYTYVEDATAENGYYYACTACGTKIDINFFKSGFSSGYNSSVTAIDGGNRFTFSDSGHLNLSYTGHEGRGGMPSQEQVVAGRYLAIKIRADLIGNLEIRIGNTNDLQANGWNYKMNTVGSLQPAYTSADEWRVLIVDLSNFNDEEYTFGKKHGILISTQGASGAGVTIDIAWVAVGDSIAEFEPLLTEGETTYYDFGTSFSNAPDHKNLDGSCVEHKISGVTANNGTYTYTCTVCGEVAYEKTVGESVSAYITPYDMKNAKQNVEKTDLTASTHFGMTGVAVALGEAPYFHFQGNNQSHKTGIFIWTRSVADNGENQSSNPERYSIDVGNARFFVIKARMNIAAYPTTPATACVKLSSTGADVNRVFYFPAAVASDGDWVTYVIDLETYASEAWVKDATSETYLVDSFWFNISPFLTTDSVDIEYMAFVEGDWADVDALVDEETVVSLTTHNKDAHNIVNVADGSIAE